MVLVIVYVDSPKVSSETSEFTLQDLPVGSPSSVSPPSPVSPGDERRQQQNMDNRSVVGGVGGGWVQGVRREIIGLGRR